MGRDPWARGEMARRGLRGVPSFLVGDEVVVGLDTRRILALLDYRVMPCPHCSKRMRVPTGKGKLTITCPRCKGHFRLPT